MTGSMEDEKGRGCERQNVLVRGGSEVGVCAGYIVDRGARKVSWRQGQ